MSEADLQKKLIKYLKSKSCYVIKTRPGPGVPAGCPDIFAFNEGLWMAFECKRGKSAPFRPGQEATLKKMKGWSFAWAVYPEYYEEVKKELSTIL